MRYLIFMGSPRKEGNTIQTVEPLTEALRAAGHETELIWLYDQTIGPCIACRVCQKDWTAFSCAIQDDMHVLAQKALEADCIIFACPIYSWYCTAPMKALLDRLVYGLNKYYGDEKGPSLWAGKQAAVVTTCGYPPQKGSDVFEEGMKRYCKHSRLRLVGTLALRDLGYDVSFMTEEKREEIAAFAKTLLDAAQ